MSSLEGVATGKPLLGIFSSLEAHSVQGGVEQLDAKWVLVDKKQWTGTEKRRKYLQGDIVLPFDLCLILVGVGSVGISWRAESREVVFGGLEICGGASLVLRASTAETEIRGGEQSENAEMGWSRPGIAWKWKRLRVLLRIEWKARKKHFGLV